MNTEEINNTLVNWFVEKHPEFVNQNSINSWANMLGIKLEKSGSLDEGELFHLFALASLWNNSPTLHVDQGINAYHATKSKYTLENFRQAQHNPQLNQELKGLAEQEIDNPSIFNLLEYIASGASNHGSVWNEIKRILHLPCAGILEVDTNRLMQLYSLFNGSQKKYGGDAYLRVKLFFVLRELRIQFKRTGQFQYHPAICCVSDSHVRAALQELGLAKNIGTDMNSLIEASKIVAQHFCNSKFEMYDLPLFFAHKEKAFLKLIENCQKRSRPPKSAGNCPVCGAPLVWRVAQKTGERYRGCTNFNGGCRWNDRSY